MAWPLRQFRVVVKCATCGATTTGPAASYEPGAGDDVEWQQLAGAVAAAFELGREFGSGDFGLIHHELCGGRLLVTVEEIPASTVGECPP